jgi:hypothetical protein
VLLAREHVQKRLRDLTEGYRISDEFLPDHGGTRRRQGLLTVGSQHRGGDFGAEALEGKSA